MKRITNFEFKQGGKKQKKATDFCIACKSRRGQYHKPDCPLGFPVINKMTDEILEAESQGLVKRVFAGNVL